MAGENVAIQFGPGTASEIHCCAPAFHVITQIAPGLPIDDRRRKAHIRSDAMNQERQRSFCRLVPAGDAMLGRGVNEVLCNFGCHYPFEALKKITGPADLFLANLECAITPKRLRFSGAPKAFYFRADPLAAKALAEAGVRVVSLANNHALDADPEGLLDTLSFLSARGIAAAGAGATDRDAARPAYLSAGGMRFGVLACCDHQEDFKAGPERPGIWHVNLRDDESWPELLKAVSELAAEVDHVVVALHWMPNWVRRIPSGYRELAERLVAAGARVLWGHSPHHFLGVEWIGRAVVLYSTGGLVDDYAIDEEFRNDRQLLFELNLTEAGVEEVRAYPVELRVGRTVPAKREAREWIGRRFRDCCEEVGSRVAGESDGALSVWPDEEFL